MHEYFRPNEQPRKRFANNGVTIQEMSDGGNFSSTYVVVDIATCHKCPILGLCAIQGYLKDEPDVAVRRTELTRDEMKRRGVNCI